MSQTISPEKPHASTASIQKASPRGWWRAGDSGPESFTKSTEEVLGNLSKPVYVIDINDKQAFTNFGIAELGRSAREDEAESLIAYAPATRLQDLGDKTFCQDHGISLPYMTGAMANGIASARLVKAVANAGLLGSFGAAGLMVDQIEEVIIELKSSLGDKPFCANLIHSPNERGQEKAVVEVYLRHQVHLVEASAYMALTLPVVRYRVHGIHRDQQGNIITPNNIIAKASRIEVAQRWFSPAPVKFLQTLLEAGEITAEQAELATQVPMAQDLSVEADSGGHTDNRPAITLIPTIVALRDRLQREYGYSKQLRVGAAGGIATPASAAAAFSMGAAYIVTGTINQACIESGSSDLARQMLADAKQADVAMAPAVDMFEMGVKLQVLKRGTMFAMRGNKLYELYRNYDAIEDIPSAELASLEKTIFKASVEEIWQNTRSFFLERDAEQVEKAEKDPKHKMALMFRWYLGLSSRWANAGIAERQVDYQIWCGPAMGAFNEWVKESLLEAPANRNVVSVALNILYGAALVTRMNMLSLQGAVIASLDRDIRPQALEKIEYTL